MCKITYVLQYFIYCEIKIMKLKKGSAEAKRFMASIRAKKKGSKI
jgi:hypothetical protein